MPKTILFVLSVAVSLASAKVDVSRVANAAQLSSLSDGAKKVLSENGLVAQPTDYTQLYGLYKAINKSNQPMFATTDCVLHSFHILFDYTLREAETRYFFGQLGRLTRSLLRYETGLKMRARGKEVSDALDMNIAYLSVAAVLLDSSFKVPKPAERLVKQELTLIEAHQGNELSPIMGVKEDYSQYVPRGHYTRSDSLARYFKAMMWYGRMPFLLKPGNGEKDEELGRVLTYRAMLLCDALQRVGKGSDNALELWRKIHEPTLLLVGNTDDLSPDDYIDLTYKVFGDRDLLQKPTRAEIDTFIARAMELRKPGIVSQVVPDTLKPEQVTKGLRFLGQRYIPDSYMFQELVYDKVGTREDPRMMPRGLDVMAVLSSDQALKYLKELYHEDHFANYETQIEKLREEFARLTPEDWNQNIYFGWLYALKLQNEPMPKSKFLPEFAFQPAYADKCLVTTGGSWAQLRHDTILYAKQSYTMLTTSVPSPVQPEKPKPIVFVEPKPAVFVQIESLTARMMTGLKQYGVLSEDMAGRLDKLNRLASGMGAIANKEAKGEQQDPGEIDLVWNIGEVMEDFGTFPAANYSNDEDKNMATVADVHTDPNTQNVLEVAVGSPLRIIAVAPYDGKMYIVLGGMLSYYEFIRPMSERMTDAQWQEMKPRPPMPEWTGSFVVQ